MAKQGEKRRVYVYANWEGLGEPILLGVLHSVVLRGKEVFSFEYDSDWLKSNHGFSLDPDLQLFKGLQYLNDVQKSNFGMFLDSSPDRWGRILMRRREAALARKEQRKKMYFYETDYLLGVHDAQRMGGLRFKLNPNGNFLNDNFEMASPPWTSIRKLEQISLRLEEDDVVNDPDYLKWLNMLVAPGSSLGGARPKASVVDNNNHLWIAKFPSKNDDTDIGAWEMITYEMALAAGIKMGEAKAEKFGSNHHTFLSKRFDRTVNGNRIHFASAMTLLNHIDGDDANTGVSYLELADFIISNGANVNSDLEEVWRRIVFSICVSNTDDHLRNHGFLWTEKGWVLSPAYDVNPVETGTGLKLNINEHENALDIDLAMEVSSFFRIKEKQAQEIIDKVKTAVKGWSSVAKKYQISRSEQELKSNAFKY